MPAWLWISLCIIAICGAFIGLLWLGWRHRQRQQRALPEPASLPAGLGEPTFAIDDIHYVATTEIERALERITVKPLGFLGRADLEVHPSGIAVGITGERAFFIPTADLIAVGRAQATIDRAVERDGLINLRWQLTPDFPVDSFFRVVDPAQRRELFDAIDSLISASTSQELV